MALYQSVQRQFAERVSIGPTQERFAIDLLGFGLLGMTVEATNGFHAGRKP